MTKNRELLNKATALFPKLIETTVHPTKTVHFQMDETGGIQSAAAPDYRTQQLKKGDRVILDFGDHQVGYFSMKLGSVGSHPDAPVWLRIHFAENPRELFEDAKNYHGWICSSWIEEEQIHVDMLPAEVKLPRRFAFRYVAIDVLDISSKFSMIMEDAVCTAVSSADDRMLLPYGSSNELHRKLDRIACRTLHNCMHLVFEDGPKRDRRLWIGDLRMQALANYQTYKNNDLVKECLYLFAALPLENGQIGACIFLEPKPEVDDTVMFDYSLLYIPTLLDYFQATGDMNTLRDLWPTALSQIYIAENQLTDQCIVQDLDRLGWCFIDWNLGLNKQASAQGVLLYAIRAARTIAEVLDDQRAILHLRELYEDCKNAANQYLWDDELACYISGEMKQISWASQIWMILGGGVEGETAGKLLERMNHMPDAEAMVTPYMYHNYIDALLKTGCKEKALECLEGYWGGMEKQGADTFWELYNPVNPNESPYGGTVVNSYCHAWSCAPAYFLRKFW